MNRQRTFLVVVVAAVLTMTACATGSSIVTGTTRPPIAAERVRLFLEPPADFEVIGLVSASSEAGWTEQAKMDYAIEELKKRAATLGANGLLLVSTSDTTTVANGYSAKGKTLQGKAIFVKGQ